MASRNVLGLVLVGGAGFLAYQAWRGNLGEMVSPPISWGPSWGNAGTGSKPMNDDYYQLLAKIESSGRELAKNPLSSASGLFQFTKRTWKSLGFPWGDDPKQPFGGLIPDLETQYQAIKTLTEDNIAGLESHGIDINNASLYAAHFLGVSTAIRVLRAPMNAPLAPLIGAAAMAANQFPKTWKVADFKTWLRRKVSR